MIRVNKLSDLMDVITDQAVARFTNRPDEISNQDLMNSLKTVQDLIERGTKQAAGVQETPLIQINQANLMKLMLVILELTLAEILVKELKTLLELYYLTYSHSNKLLM